MGDASVLKTARWNPAIVLGSFLANLLALALPLALLQIYDRVIPNAAYETLFVLAAMVMVALLVDAALRLARARLLAFFAADFEVYSYQRALWALVMEDPTQRKRADHGTLMTRMAAIDRLRGFSGNSATAALLDLPFALLFLVVIAVLAPAVAVVVAAMLALTFIGLTFLRRRIDRARQRRIDLEARRYSFFSEVLANIMPVRALGITDLMSRRQERLLERSASQTRVLTADVHLAQGLAAAVGNLTPLVTAAIAGFLVLDGQASMGVLAAAVVLSGRIVQPVLRLEGFMAELDNVRQAEEDLKSLTQAPLKQNGSRPLDRVESLELRDVSTSPDPDLGLGLNGVTLSLKPGDCLLLRSDSPVQLIAAERLFLGEASLLEGQIMVNGTDLAEYDLRDRQRRIRILPEEAQLLAGTLFDNICAFEAERYGSRALELAQELGLQKIMRQNPKGVLAKVQPESTDIPQSAKRIASNISGLVTRPDVIVFRAAYTGLDHDADKRMLNWFSQNAAKHILIMTTNRPSYAKLATKTLDLAEVTSAPAPV
ncbi:hypothetical protein So717_36600 [Roseobacter cerasinus]|uniref:ABC transmembrane type-1 domain-containing protein n=2 Tax=Roseobacter cerasinus TaxID=2602289 RepID=A0A640VVM3_9RHOB|nr:hypothetical protein So717_36600 [Roseobacter cerasinus]